MKKFILAIFVVLGLILPLEYFFFRFSHFKPAQEYISSVTQKKDPYAEFVGEIYDIVKENYWEEVNDEQLSNRFLVASRELAPSQVLSSKDKKGVKKLIGEITKDLSPQKKKELTLKLSELTLASLLPNNRSRLYAQVNKEALKNLVQNVDPKTDLYKNLNVSKQAPQEEVKKAYEEKVTQIKEEVKSPQEAAKKLEETNRAYEALKTPEKRELYDKYKIEPTVSNKFIRPGILYIPIKRISPQTFQEFVNEVQRIKPEEHGDALILDLRGNIGGSIDLLPSFLGPFIGKNQYAFEFYKRGKPIPVKTVTDWLPSLVPYKNVVVLVDQNTQSSAEIIASVLKKYNAGVLVGTKTKGWGTIERVFDLKTQLDATEKYSLFLVHTITLREDGQPMEGRGVEPLIDITQKDWDKELLKYFHRSDLVEAVKGLVS